MENKLEQLLNTLIQRGWKPFGRNSNKAYYRPEGPDEFYFGENGYGYIYNWRQVVSKESGLWQLVCENGMVNVDETEVYYFWLKRKGTLDRGHYYLSEAGEDIRTNNFEYRLIESSLKDESELEDFLLSNIKVEGEGQKHS